jgi:hypothetical protein
VSNAKLLEAKEWWEHFKSCHDDWQYADKDALIVAAYQAGAENSQPDFSRRVAVENVLLNIACGKRPTLTPEECKQLAYQLGVPEWFREKALKQNQEITPS